MRKFKVGLVVIEGIASVDLDIVKILAFFESVCDPRRSSE